MRNRFGLETGHGPDDERFHGFWETILGIILGLALAIGIIFGIPCAIMWGIIKLKTIFILAIIFLSAAIAAKLVKIVTHFWDHYDEDPAEGKEGS